MKLVASDGLLTADGHVAVTHSHEGTKLARAPGRERMFLADAGDYFRRTAKHRNDPMLCQLCGSPTEAFLAQQLRVSVLGQESAVFAWKNDVTGRHVRVNTRSNRFCSTHNQRNVQSQYRSARKTSDVASAWKKIIGSKYSDAGVPDQMERDMALALSNPRIGQRLIDERLSLLSKAASGRLEFIEKFWCAFSGGADRPADLKTAKSIELTYEVAGDQKEYGQYRGDRYRVSVVPGLHKRVLAAFPTKSDVSKFLSWESAKVLTSMPGTPEDVVVLPEALKEFYELNSGVSDYEDFLEEAASQATHARRLVLWMPTIRGWLF
jgi:hypothetical protein